MVPAVTKRDTWQAIVTGKPCKNWKGGRCKQQEKGDMAKQVAGAVVTEILTGGGPEEAVLTGRQCKAVVKWIVTWRHEKRC